MNTATKKVRMLMDINHKVNGARMGPYLKGREYDLDAQRADLFLGSAMAEEVVEPVVEEPAVEVAAAEQPEAGQVAAAD